MLCLVSSSFSVSYRVCFGFRSVPSKWPSGPSVADKLPSFQFYYAIWLRYRVLDIIPLYLPSMGCRRDGGGVDYLFLTSRSFFYFVIF